MTRTVRTALAVLAVVLATGALPRAGADDAVVGWWTSSRLLDRPIGQATLVPDGGAQVARGVDGPTSIAAVRFPADGAATLVLGIEPSSTPASAAVVACPAVEAWEPVEGGDLADTPAWDCALGQVAGTVDEDAGTLTLRFPADLAGADPSDPGPDVVLLPTADAAPFTLTLSPPGEDAVTREAARSPTSSTTSTTSATPTTTPTPAGGSIAPVPAPRPTPVPTAAGAPSPIPPPTAPVGLPAPLPTTTTVLEQAAPAAASPGDAADPGRILGGLVLLGLLAGAVLVLRPAPTPEVAPVRGVGRFARPRSDPPVDVSG